MSDFLKKKEVNKCTSCRVKPTDINFKAKSSLWKKKGEGDVLILVDMVEYDTMLTKLVNFLDAKGITSYQIYSTCLCRTHTFVLPSPAYQVYNYCDCVDLSKLQYKTIICVGRTLSYLIQGDDFQYWGDFSEFLFNQTYFIHNNKRVYPVPCLSEWMGVDTLQNKFVLKQIGFIKEHLKNYHSFIVNPYEIIKVDEPNDFYKQYMAYEGEMAWDTETSSLDHFDPNFRVGCITISFDGNKGYYLPFDDNTDRRLLSKFFKNKYQILANGKYDVKAMLRSRVSNARVDEDITILAHLLNTERQKSGLKTLAWYVGLGGYDSTLDKALKDYKCETYLDIPEKILMQYAGMDAIATFRIWKWLKKDLVPKQQMIYDTYKKYIIPVIPVFTKAEMRGMDIDVDYMNKLNADIKSELKEAERAIQEKLGTKFNINSNKQLGEVLERKGFPLVDRKKDGGYKTGAAQLEFWRRKGFDVATDLLNYRGLIKLKTSFVGEIAEEVDQVDTFLGKGSTAGEKVEGLAKYIANGVIHGTFSPARTNSYRSSSQNPNFQNIPKSGYAGKRVRPLFACPEDYYICETDQSGFQLRIGAIYSGDAVMKDIFLNRGGDMHSITAQGVFCRNISLEEFLTKKNEEPYKTYRNKAKAVNFGFLFGRGAFSFKRDLEDNWTIEEVEDYIQSNKLSILTDQGGKQDKYLTVSTEIRSKFFETYPGLEKWINHCIKEAQQLGYRDCPLGGRRHLPLMLFSNVTGASNNKEKAHYENIAINSTVQTFEALTMYKALVEIDNEIVKHNLKSIIVGMVHDSIVLYVHKSEVEQMYHIIKNAMEDKDSFDIPLEAEVEMGQVWGFGKEVTEKNLKEF